MHSSSTMEAATHAAAHCAAMEATSHVSIASVERGHCMIVKSMTNRDWTASIKVAKSSTNHHRGSPYHQR